MGYTIHSEKYTGSIGTPEVRLQRTTNHARRATVLGVQLPNQRRKKEDVENASEHEPKDKRKHLGVGNTCKSVNQERKQTSQTRTSRVKKQVDHSSDEIRLARQCNRTLNEISRPVCILVGFGYQGLVRQTYKYSDIDTDENCIRVSDNKNRFVQRKVNMMRKTMKIVYLSGCNSQRSRQVVRVERQQRREIVRVERRIDQSKLSRLQLHRVSCMDAKYWRLLGQMISMRS